MFYPLQAIKAEKGDREYQGFYPQDICIHHKIAHSLRLQASSWSGKSGDLFDKALKSHADNITIPNPKFDKSLKGKAQALPDKITALSILKKAQVYCIALLMGIRRFQHCQVFILVSTLITQLGKRSFLVDGIRWWIVLFQCDVLFDATSSVPIETIGKKLLQHIGFMFGMTNVGDERNEALR